jgi:hypothetical protein
VQNPFLTELTAFYDKTLFWVVSFYGMHIKNVSAGSKEGRTVEMTGSRIDISELRGR